MSTTSTRLPRCSSRASSLRCRRMIIRPMILSQSRSRRGRGHHHVEQAVVVRRTGDQVDVRRDAADVADQHHHRLVVLDRAVVDLDPHRHRQPPQRLAGGDEVGRGADRLLQVAADLVHDHRVQPGAGHHGEVLGLAAVHGDLDQVDVPGGAVGGDLDGAAPRCAAARGCSPAGWPFRPARCRAASPTRTAPRPPHGPCRHHRRRSPGRRPPPAPRRCGPDRDPPRWSRARARRSNPQRPGWRSPVRGTAGLTLTGLKITAQRRGSGGTCASVAD